jgi:hypothetical protein
MHCAYTFSGRMETPGTPTLTVKITDPALIRRIRQDARSNGTDIDNPAWLEHVITKCGRQHFGLDRDLSVTDVATRLGCCRNTVKNYFRAGRFPKGYYRANGLREIRIPLADVEALAERTLRVAA